MFIDDENVPQTALEVPGGKIISACGHLVPSRVPDKL